jgi:DNA-binding MarR family transcriptional regulator
MALLASIAAFAHVIGGLTNRNLRQHMAALYDDGYTPARATYDLRRLRLKGLIERVDGTHTYRVTRHGRAIATFLTKLATRVIIPTLTDLTATTGPQPPAPRPLTAAWHAYEHQLDKLIADQIVA